MSEREKDIDQSSQETTDKAEKANADESESSPQQITEEEKEATEKEKKTGEAKKEEQAAEEKISEEELKRRLEEQLEKITVADVATEMMITLSSLAYQKFGLPAEVNAKYRDLDQAKLAIDCLSALLDVCERVVVEDRLEPLKGTVANLKLLYVKERE